MLSQVILSMQLPFAVIPLIHFTSDRRRMGAFANSLQDQGIAVETTILHSTSPGKEIVRFAREMQPDLLIMGAHGHGGLKDLIFGTTISPVRHNLNIPMLVVRPGKG
jgi:manganese transport protein